MTALLEIDTIVAVATPPGRGGIGVLRLSGPDSVRISALLIKTKRPLTPARARYGLILDDTGERIDDALGTWFQAPRSYTGEDVVEISTHGSPVVLDWLLNHALRHGARLARPGEFTERAFLQGRIDLTQAEAVRDLIDAQTLEQAKLAAQQIGGALAAKVRPVKQHLIQLIATLEAGIDFAEDDIDTLPFADIASRIEILLGPLTELLGTFAYGRILRDGLRLAIVGRPNVGKSSLFNRLVERERAIVTATPGTTRDVVAERISLNGIPVELMDTAGLRDTADEIEQIGIARSYEAIAEADLILLVTDATDSGQGALLDIQSRTDALVQSQINAQIQSRTNLQRQSFEMQLLEKIAGRPVILVHNKIDLLAPADLAALPEASGQTLRGVPTSVLTGQGIPTLREAILTAIGGHGSTGTGVGSNDGTGLASTGIGVIKGESSSGEKNSVGLASNSSVLTNIRQRDAVAHAVDALTRAAHAAHQSIPHELLLIDLYEALRALDELTGDTATDEVLNLIFSTFCIGK